MKNVRTMSVPALLVLVASALPFGATFATGSRALTEGQVHKIDTEQGKITIKHGPIANLQMPPMTMVFGVQDVAMLAGVAKGDKVAFYVVDQGGKMVIEELEKAE